MTALGVIVAGRRRPVLRRPGVPNLARPVDLLVGIPGANEDVSLAVDLVSSKQQRSRESRETLANVVPDFLLIVFEREQIGRNRPEVIDPDTVVVDVLPQPDEQQPVLAGQLRDVIGAPELRLDGADPHQTDAPLRLLQGSQST